MAQLWLPPLETKGGSDVQRVSIPSVPVSAPQGSGSLPFLSSQTRLSVMALSGRKNKCLFLSSVMFCNRRACCFERHWPLILVLVPDSRQRLFKSYLYSQEPSPPPNSSLYLRLPDSQREHWVMVVVGLLVGPFQEESSMHLRGRLAGIRK